LTPREQDVIGYVALGKSNKVIALELGLSMRTVETHRARIFRKMGVRNATELARRVYAPHSLEQGSMPTLHEPPPSHDSAHPVVLSRTDPTSPHGAVSCGSGSDAGQHA